MKLRSTRGLETIMWVLWTGVCAGVLTLAGIYLYLSPQLPSAETYRHVRLETPLRVFAADGSLMAEFGERRVIPVTLADVPPLFVRAILDTEDKRFYEHSGVDLITLFNSAVELAANMGEITRGGSTITMQLPRNLGTFSLDQVFIRKFKEILLALKIERELTKDQILELYINAVPFGKRAYGAQAAAYTYYGKPLAELALPELAMIAGIPQAPTAGNPINGPERAMKRRNTVLQRMLEQGSISESEYEAALSSPNTARLHERELAVYAPYAAEWVRQILVGRMGTEVYAGGYEATTSIDPRLQSAANVAVREGLLRYDRRHGYRGPAGHIDLAGTQAPDANALVAALTQYPLHPGLEPALVTAVGDTGISVLRGTGETVEIAFELMRWARPYVDPNTRGPAPARPADVASAGDVVYVRQLPEGWALSQPPAVQGALVALEPRTGAVKALVGGYDFATNQFNHATQGGRQPGSGFKPFVYSAALEYGITPATVFMDAPLVFEDESLETTYRPKNDRSRFNGPTRLREALVRSRNLVSIRVLQSVGPEAALEHAAKCGFKTEAFPKTLSLALGTQVVSPLEMATGFAVFANGGFKVDPYFISRIEDSSGKVLFHAEPKLACPACEQAASYPVVVSEVVPSDAEPADGADAVSVAAAAPMETPRVFGDDAPEPLRKLASLQGGIGYLPAARVAPRVLSPQNAWLMNSMMHDVAMRGTARRTTALGRDDLAGKTGTNGERDLWFNGFNSRLVASVWVGYDDERSLGEREEGGTAAVPIWMYYMREALRGVPSSTMPRPGGLIDMKVNALTGTLTSPDDPEGVYETFMLENQPRMPEPGEPGYASGNSDPNRPAEKASAEPLF